MFDTVIVRVCVCVIHTRVEERVGVASYDHVDPSHSPGDFLILFEPRVSQGDDLVDAQSLQLVDLNADRLHLILKLQVRA